MVIQDSLGNIQSQAAAAAVPVPGFVHPVEGSEDTLQIFLGNVYAGIPVSYTHLTSPFPWRVTPVFKLSGVKMRVAPPK